MIFTASQFLYGLIFAVLPIIIHIIAKKRIRNVRISSILFLQKAVEKAARKYRIKDLILLILRILIIVFLVLSIAKPVKYKSISAKDADALKKKRKSVVFVFDNSLSMGQLTSGESLLKKGKRAVIKIIENELQEGDTASVIVLSDRNPIKFYDLTYNIKNVREIIDNIGVSYLTPDIFAGLKSAEALLDKSSYSVRVIYFITDLQKRNFTDSEGLLIYKDINIKYPIFLISLAESEVKNSAIIKTSVPSVLNFKSDSIRISSEINNFSVKKNNLIIKTFVDDKPFGQKSIELDGKSKDILTFDNRVDNTGFIYGYSEIADGDELIQDNKNYFVFYIPKKISIEVTEEKNEMFYFINSLNPYFILKKENNNPIEIFYGHSIKEQSNLDVLTVSQDTISGEDVKFIKKFLKSGKSILIFPTEQLDINNFNQYYSKNYLLPGSIFNFVKVGKDSPLSLEFIDYSHPIFKIFEDYKSFKSVKIYQYYKFNVEYSSVNLKILARLSNGDPAIIEYAPFGTEVMGSGKIILFLFSPVPESSDIIYHPSFPPMVHQIIKYLAMPSLIDDINNFKVGVSINDVKNILDIN